MKTINNFLNEINSMYDSIKIIYQKLSQFNYYITIEYNDIIYRISPITFNVDNSIEKALFTITLSNKEMKKLNDNNPNALYHYSILNLKTNKIDIYFEKITDDLESDAVFYCSENLEVEILNLAKKYNFIIRK